MSFGGIRKLLLCAALLLGVAAAAGCGDDEKSAAQEGGPPPSEASESPDVVANRLAKLLETSTKEDCSGIARINTNSLYRFSCPSNKKLRRSMESFEVVGAKAYGTGAVVDYTSGTAKDGATILLFVDPKRKWAISRFGLLTKPSTKTSDAGNRDGYAKAVADYLAAARARDCDALLKVAYTEGEKKQACKAVLEATKSLAKRVKANPSTKAAYEGGNGTYGFFTYETPKPLPDNSTISVIDVPNSPRERFIVLDSASSPTAAEQRVLRRQEREQQQTPEPDQVETSKSRKAD